MNFPAESLLAVRYLLTVKQNKVSNESVLGTSTKNVKVISRDKLIFYVFIPEQHRYFFLSTISSLFFSVTFIPSVLVTEKPDLAAIAKFLNL